MIINVCQLDIIFCIKELKIATLFCKLTINKLQLLFESVDIYSREVMHTKSTQVCLLFEYHEQQTT